MLLQEVDRLACVPESLFHSLLNQSVSEIICIILANIMQTTGQRVFTMSKPPD